MIFNKGMNSDKKFLFEGNSKAVIVKKEEPKEQNDLTVSDKKTPMKTENGETERSKV
jgi:hypothetical protein